MLTIVMLIAKIIMLGLRLTGRTGTALPGLVAERLYPQMMSRMLGSLPEGVVVVTGTNGKTTTTKIICELFESQGKRVISNPSGSNFTRGVFSALVRHGSLSGQLDYDIGVFELDEAYSRLFTKQVNPRTMLVLNIMRDQLDRYGEIDTTARHIGEAISHAGGVVLNADDAPVAALSQYLKRGEARYFGVSNELREFLPSDDELHGKETVELKQTPPKNLMLSKARMTSGEERITFVEDDQQYTAHFPLEGVHNGLNAVAAVTTVKAVLPKANTAKLAMALSRIHPAFGRGEQLVVRDRNLHIALVKNPGGFNQNLRAFIKEQMRVILILINDNYADGRDTSWLWDVDFSELKAHNAAIIVGGIRAHDMALRLQYENIDVDAIEPDISKALDAALSSGNDLGDVLVFPTYTAMLETRKALEKETSLEGIW